MEFGEMSFDEYNNLNIVRRFLDNIIGHKIFVEWNVKVLNAFATGTFPIINYCIKSVEIMSMYSHWIL